MVIRSTAPFYGKRFIGDKGGQVVHDSLFERRIATITTCGIDELVPEHIRTFSPDTLEQAKKEGFTPCPVCLWTEK